MDNGHDNDAAQAGDSNSAPQGIFSSPDLTVNTENLEEIKPELGEDDRSRIASAFAQTDATAQHDQLSAQMAEQEAVSGTILPAQNSTTSTATGDINLPHAKKKSKLPLVLAGIVILAGITAGMVWFLMGKREVVNQPTTAIGHINAAIIYDQTAPIPAIFGNSYGYMNPDDGSQLIGATFASAERFYGEYAIVKNGTSDTITSTSIINRIGEVIFNFSGDAAATYYDIENNLWMVNGDVYNTDMQKLSPTNTKGSYIGNGYLLVMSETSEVSTPAQEESTGNNKEDEDDGSSSSASESANGEQNALTTIGSIYDLESKKIVYNCEAYCSAFTIKVDEEVYGLVRIWGLNSQVINLANSQTIYQTQGTIALQDGGLVERVGGNNTFLKIQDSQVIKTSQPETTPATISNAGEYIIEMCNNSNKYLIKTPSGRVISDCNIDDYYELPASLYIAYNNKFNKSPIIILKDDELQLFNMDDAQVIQIYRGQSAALFENSPFVYMQNLPNNEGIICNILNEGDDACSSLGNDSQTVNGYGYYLTANDGVAEHIYNAELKEIR